MNSGSTPPGGDGRDPPRPRTSIGAAVRPTRRLRPRFVGSAARHAPRPTRPIPSRLRQASLPSPASATPAAARTAPSDPAEPAPGRDTAEPPPPRHRIAGGLPPQPAPLATVSIRPRPPAPGAANAAVVSTPPVPGSTKATAAASQMATGASAGGAKSNPPVPPSSAPGGGVQARRGYRRNDLPWGRSVPPRPRPDVQLRAPARRLGAAQPGWCSGPGSLSRRYPAGRSMDLARR